MVLALAAMIYMDSFMLLEGWENSAAWVGSGLEQSSKGSNAVTD